MSIARKLRPTLILFAMCAAPAFGQDWGVGASIGYANDVEHRVRLRDFDPRDVNAWVDFRLEERVLFRATLGSIRTAGINSGLVTDIGGEELELPGFKTNIDYLDVAAAYTFWEGDFTSGLFGGIGGYKIDPDRVDPEFREFQDREETVFGFHAGIDGDLRVYSRISIVGRITFHKIFTDVNRSLLTANVGAAFRF